MRSSFKDKPVLERQLPTRPVGDLVIMAFSEERVGWEGRAKALNDAGGEAGLKP